MREFAGFGEFADYLLSLNAVQTVAVARALDESAALIEKDAKAEIGTYQEAVGPFPAWAPLAPSTVADRVRQGYAPDEPLLREGDLRDSITHETRGLDAVVGSNSDIAVYQELGTEHIPPRPFLGPAAVHDERAVVRKLAEAQALVWLGSSRVPLGIAHDDSE